jgi:hypothetical protein
LPFNYEASFFAKKIVKIAPPHLASLANLTKLIGQIFMNMFYFEESSSKMVSGHLPQNSINLLMAYVGTSVSVQSSTFDKSRAG